MNFKLLIIICSCLYLVTGYSVKMSRKANPDGITGAVAADAKACSEVGAYILNRGGSAVDSAISTMLCAGVVNLHSTGVSGGGFMLVYDRVSKKAKVIDFKEKAPQEATRDMFKGNKQAAMSSGKAIGVPGEIRGFRKAHEKYGKLPWKTLVQPALNLARNGFKITRAPLKDDPGLKELLLDANNNLKNQGDVIKNPKYAATLEAIRDDPEDFYTGQLADKIVKDIQGFGGNVTKNDLNNYQAIERKALRGVLGDMNIFTVPPPASGVVLNYILNTLRGYNMTAADRDGDKASILTYHRIIEAFKFGFAARSNLGDPDDQTYGDRIKKAAEEFTKPSTGDSTRMLIWDNQTHSNVSYYEVDRFFTKVDYGTSHSVVLAPNGDAASVTSSINYWFGCGKRSTVTGIIYNNIMADFDNPGDDKIDGLYPSQVNFPGPGKRPQSSMTPTVFTSPTGKVRLVNGASGGKIIITANALVIMNKMWFGRTLEQSVVDPRVHSSLVPSDFVNIEDKTSYRLSDSIVKGLIKLGHNTTYTTNYAAVQAIYVNDDGEIEAMSDPRKGGEPAYSNRTAPEKAAVGLLAADFTHTTVLILLHAVVVLIRVF